MIKTVKPINLYIAEDANNPVFRYTCPRCEGVGYYAEQIEDVHPIANCISCGVSLPEEIDQEQFRELTLKEKQTLKGYGS